MCMRHILASLFGLPVTTFTGGVPSDTRTAAEVANLTVFSPWTHSEDSAPIRAVFPKKRTRLVAFRSFVRAGVDVDGDVVYCVGVLRQGRA